MKLFCSNLIKSYINNSRKNVFSLIQSKYCFQLIVIFVFFAIGSSGCESKNEGNTPKVLSQKEIDSLNEIKSRKIPPIDTFPEIHYQLFKFTSNIKRNHFFDSLKNVSNFSPYILKTLNRKEYNFVISSDQIIVPDVFYNDSRAYSIFPPFYKGAKDIAKFIMVSAHYQGMALYEWGVQVKFFAVNSGKEKTPSYPGRYALTFRQLERKSSIDSNWIMKYYFNFHPEAGMAFHQFLMPGYPASHSCMRMFLEDAMFLYSWGKGVKLDSNKKKIPLSGTPVLILDYYPFGVEYRPWMNIASNRSISFKLPEDPMKVEEPLIPIIQIPQEVRGMLRNKERFYFAEDSLRKLGVIRQGVELTPSVNFNKQRRIKQQKEFEAKKKKEMLEKMNPVQNNSVNGQ